MVKNHGVVVTFGSEPAHERDSNTADQGFVDAGLMFEQGMVSADSLDLDGDLLAGDNVGAEIDVAETAAANLSAEAVLFTYKEILFAQTQISH